MNWDDLRIFLAVAREGSISGGAKQLGVQHSTVSRRIRTLEEKLGVRLLERKKSGYELTSAGETLKSSATKMEHAALEADSVIGDRDTKITGVLRVAAINNMASTILMPMFTSFSKKYPDVDLHIMVSNKYTSLTERQADIAIRLTNTPTDTLIGKRLVTVASTVYGSHTYINNVKTGKVDPQWLGVECCGFHQTWTKDACPNHKHNLYVDDTLLTVAALTEDAGLAYLPCFMGDSNPRLERYCNPDPELNLGLWLLFHPDLKRTARVLAFKDYMIDKIATQKDLFSGK